MFSVASHMHGACRLPSSEGRTVDEDANDIFEVILLFSILLVFLKLRVSARNGRECMRVYDDSFAVGSTLIPVSCNSTQHKTTSTDRTRRVTARSQSSAATCALKSVLLRVFQTAQRGCPDQAATGTAVAAAVADEAAGETAARVGAVRVAAARVAEGDAVRTDDAAAPEARVVAVETVAKLGAVAAEAGTAVARPLAVVAAEAADDDKAEGVGAVVVAEVDAPVDVVEVVVVVVVVVVASAAEAARAAASASSLARAAAAAAMPEARAAAIPVRGALPGIPESIAEGRAAGARTAAGTAVAAGEAGLEAAAAAAGVTPPAAAVVAAAAAAVAAMAAGLGVMAERRSDSSGEAAIAACTPYAGSGVV
jgi:hypothetical protein